MVAQIWAAGQVEREMGWYLAWTIACLLLAYLTHQAQSRSQSSILQVASMALSSAATFRERESPVSALVGLFSLLYVLLCPELADKKNACVLVDLLLHWQYEERPKLKVGYAGRLTEG
jgi:hypothetical protein